MSDMITNQEENERQLGEKSENIMNESKFNFSEEPPWLKHAMTCLNLNCKGAGDFVNLMLKTCNLPENPNKTFPISFTNYGKSCEYMPGAILVFDEHVGIIQYIDGHSIKIISCHDKKIQITDASEHGDILSCRRPENFAL